MTGVQTCALPICTDYFGSGECPSGWNPDYWFDGRNYLDGLSSKEKHLWRQATSDEWKEHNISEEMTWAFKNSEKAIEYIKTSGSDPFFLVVSYDEPHHPYFCPPEYVTEFNSYHYPLKKNAYDNLSGKPFHQHEWAKAQNLTEVSTFNFKEGYFCEPELWGCNAFVDDQIGRVIKAVETHAPENTYMFFTSDHGDLLGAHGLRGKGWCMYEEEVRVPFIVVPPDRSRLLNEGVQNTTGRTVETSVSHIDLLPTMLDIAGLETPPILEGRSLLPVIEGRADEITDEPIFIEYQRHAVNHDMGGLQPIRCIRKGNYKLIINLMTSDELYDLSSDPEELKNRISDPATADVREDLLKELICFMNKNRDPFRGVWWERREWNTSSASAWDGYYRDRPDDGYEKEALDYNTGKKSGNSVKHYGVPH